MPGRNPNVECGPTRNGLLALTMEVRNSGLPAPVICRSSDSRPSPPPLRAASVYARVAAIGSFLRYRVKGVQVHVSMV